ncbi:MAG: hypothetical protein Q9159_004466 [Coniocarpon cinnabarinum]
MIGRILKFPSGSAWRLSSLIHASCHHYDVDEGLAESVGVFVCRSLNQQSVMDKEAIIKIWLQHDPSNVRADAPDDFDCDFSDWSMGQSEQKWLTLLQYRGCTSVPLWCEATTTTQDDDMPYPGGFQINLVEQKLPGHNLLDFFDRYDESEREAIREAFRPALT